MPKFPRDIRQAQAIAAFVELGGTERQGLGGTERQGKGSHRLVKMPNGRNLSIPAGAVKVGLLKKAIQTAEVTEDDFLSAAGR